MITIKPLSPKSPLEQALELAREFKGKKNSDWTPIIMKLGEIEPSTPLPDLEMCLVPVGKFMMGAEDWSNTKPIHEQIIRKLYWIARYPVTNAQWLVAVNAGAVKEPVDFNYRGERNPLKWYQDTEMADCPVVGIDWFESRKFALWAKCELPPENLWEYAARGIENLTYPWGNDFVGDNVVYDKNSGSKPNPVSSKPEGVSWVGAGHFSGNVWEWCLSAYVDYPYVSSDGREDVNRTDIPIVLCGGSWFNGSVCAAIRDRRNPSNGNNGIGFRCLRFH